jgi:hypothetical protein
VKPYTDIPLVMRELFDKETHSTIVRYVNEFVPMFPLSADRREQDGPGKFGRRYAHNLPFFVSIHHQLKEYASEIFGVEVKPSYSFLSMYDKGGKCPLHVDRPQCRYTIDYLIRQDSSKPWPINIGPQMSDDDVAKIEVPHPATKKEIKSVIDSVDWSSCLLNPNDAVCYSGTNAWHYRPTASVGAADLVFFHFVPKDFSGSLN